MGIITSNKYISTDSISCSGEFTVTLALSAAPDLTAVPADIALVLDASMSTDGEPIENIRAAASDLIDVLSENLAAGGLLCCGNEAAVISYASDSAILQPLTDDPALLLAAINSITASGNSNLAAGIEEAVGVLAGSTSGNQKVMFVFTDGRYNTGIDPAIAAANAREAGITVYFVAVNGSEPADVEAMSEWASQPSSAYVITDFDEGGTYENFLANLAENLTVSGSTDISVAETIAADFTIVSAAAPTAGTVTVTGARTLTWNIASLGTEVWEGAALTFTVRHTGSFSGEKPVDESVIFDDASGNTAVFNNPVILVDCGDIDYVVPCPEPVDVVSPACQEVITVDAGSVSLGLSGRVAQVNVTLRNVCPGRRVALAVVLTELDEEGVEYQRGMRTLLIPAHNFESCRDINVECISFVIPEEVDDITAQACGERSFRARVYANIIDSGFECCGLTVSSN